MFDLSKIRDYERERQQREFINRVKRAVRETMAPFRPGEISVWWDYDLDRLEWRWVTSIALYPDTEHIQRMDADDVYDMAKNTMQLAIFLGSAAGSYFNHVYRTAPGANHILGEN